MTSAFLLGLLGMFAAQPSTLCGTYEWGSGGFVDLIVWDELGPGRLVVFDDRGTVRVLFPSEAGTFAAGQSIAVPDPVEARVRFEPLGGIGPPATLVWESDGGPRRVASRVEDCREEDLLFANGDTRLAGTLLLPTTVGPHPALVLLHGSGDQNRRGTLPFARFLVREGIAVFTFDKRGVGASRGDWRKASFETLAADALAAVALLRSRSDIDPTRIGLFGVSQGGWIGPLAASRSPDVALVVSISGPGVTPAEQTLDLVEGELRVSGVPEAEIQEAVALTRKALHYGRTGEGWAAYRVARERSRERSWLPYLQLPEQAADQRWEQQRLFWHYDPGPALAALRVPVLALFGGRDTGIPVDKNRRRWEDGLARAGHAANSLVVLPAANHLMLESASGSMFELEKLDRFVPEYRTIVSDWLRERFLRAR